jgi:hypothetical protein
MEPKTRTEIKKQGKRDGGPYSSKHVRLLEAVMAKTPGAKKVPATSASIGGSAKKNAK